MVPEKLGHVYVVFVLSKRVGSHLAEFQPGKVQEILKLRKHVISIKSTRKNFCEYLNGVQDGQIACQNYRCLVSVQELAAHQRSKAKSVDCDCDSLMSLKLVINHQ